METKYICTDGKFYYIVCTYDNDSTVVIEHQDGIVVEAISWDVFHTKYKRVHINRVCEMLNSK